MTTFDEREQAFERLFAHEEEVRFHARNRRNQLLAAWAGERMRLTGQAAEGYITAFVEHGAVTGDEALIAKLQADLKAAGDRRGRCPPCTRRWPDAPRARAGMGSGVALDQGSAA
ncbi:DUF1476 domain-containing protein [Methylobacterium oryzae CBMB20]